MLPKLRLSPHARTHDYLLARLSALWQASVAASSEQRLIGPPWCEPGSVIARPRRFKSPEPPRPPQAPRQPRPKSAPTRERPSLPAELPSATADVERPAFLAAKATLEQFDPLLGPTTYRADAEAYHATKVLEQVVATTRFVEVADCLDAVISDVEKAAIAPATPPAAMGSGATGSSTDVLALLAAAETPLVSRSNTLGEVARMLQKGVCQAAIDIATRLLPVRDVHALAELGASGHRLATAVVDANLTASGLLAPSAPACFAIRHVGVPGDAGAHWEFTHPEEAQWDDPEEAALQMGAQLCAASSETPLLHRLPPKPARNGGAPDPLPPAFHAGLNVFPSCCGPPVDDHEIEALLAELPLSMEPSTGRYTAAGSDAWATICAIADGYTPGAGPCRRSLLLTTHYSLLTTHYR